VYDPIAPMKVLATNEMFRDPALADVSDAELEQYRTDRDLEALAPRLQGEPTLFEIRRLPPVAAMSLDGLPAVSRWFAAFGLACQRVACAGGEVMEADPRKLKPSSHGTKIADDEWFNKVSRRFGIATCYEMGRVAHEWARLPEKDRGPFSF